MGHSVFCLRMQHNTEFYAINKTNDEGDESGSAKMDILQLHCIIVEDVSPFLVVKQSISRIKLQLLIVRVTGSNLGP